MREKINNKEIKGFNLENKMGLQKLTCSIRDKKKSNFLKRVKDNLLLD